MGRSPGFGSTTTNYAPYSDSLSLRLRVPRLTSLVIVTRRSVLQKVPPGVLFTFPSRYWFTIGHQVVFSLGGWSLRIPTGFLVSRGTRDSVRLILPFIYRGLTSYAGAFQLSSTKNPSSFDSPTTPMTSHRFGLFPVRSPLLRKSSFLSLPLGTKMFQFPRFAYIPYVFRYA